ncbi:WecB/TagA/CpsF family glycosyltransferase [Carboxylicivirga mesophila]|uniref:WecB/TagA/CpsF family glycosyltransferase n=1 Tax=Carboxylicivirga mesophila TaxID=1166478 RepID=A0ABS5K5F1_9BACT|nr:WecB/TagA/CpsF family glycosyltransferase [Carboxylicivirga mesophila]MBS2210215.1 WecB/TagA/CpsF family glycosyltransferase [Carboxylicivirga mesophila]
MKIKESEVEVLSYAVYKGNLDCEERLFSAEKMIINTINAYSYVLAKGDNDFKTSLCNSDILLPDGFPIVIASRMLNGIRIKKIAGEDIFKHMLKLGNTRKKRFFFLGSSNETLLKIERRIRSEYPNIAVSYFSPPFKASFTNEENQDMINRVNNFKPDALFIGMTAPKQEKWVELNKEKLDAKVICSIGAVFDFYAGTVKRPSKFWISLRLEWFIRLANEPKRLWKRYLIYSPKFFIDVFKAKFDK